MRNLAQYPITAEEVQEVLRGLISEDNRHIGSIRPVIAGALLRVLEVQLDKDLTVMDLVLEEIDGPLKVVEPENKCEHDYKLDFSACTWRRFKCTVCGEIFIQDRD